MDTSTVSSDSPSTTITPSFSTPFILLEQLERHSRLQIVDHQIDCFENLLDVFCSVARLVVGNNQIRALATKNRSLQNQCEASRTTSSELTVQIEREATARDSAERRNDTAVQLFEYWRRKSSEQAQQMNEVNEARQIAHEAATFWKARALVATAALKHLTAEELNFSM